jgi:hypothetical protein
MGCAEIEVVKATFLFPAVDASRYGVLKGLSMAKLNLRRINRPWPTHPFKVTFLNIFPIT